jgi:hypothetical protein
MRRTVCNACQRLNECLDRLFGRANVTFSRQGVQVSGHDPALFLDLRDLTLECFNSFSQTFKLVTHDIPFQPLFQHHPLPLTRSQVRHVRHAHLPCPNLVQTIFQYSR